MIKDPNSSQTQSLKYFFINTSGILQCLVQILKQINLQELILKHKDGKTIKFILRNLFFFNSLILTDDSEKKDGDDGLKLLTINLEETWNVNKKSLN